jgi:hypothetical protein
MGRIKNIPARVSKFEVAEAYRETQKPLTKAERRVIWDRLAKKFLRAQGYIAPKIPLKWQWSLGEQSGVVEAFTKSEARAAVKRALNLSKKRRLPVEVCLEKVTA